MPQPLRSRVLHLLLVLLASVSAVAQTPEPSAATAAGTPTTAAAAPAAPNRGGNGYDYYASGDVGTATHALTEGALMLMGGGSEVDAAFRWLIAKAGGGHLVVLRASGNDSYHRYLYEELGGLVSVETLVFHNRSAASDSRMLEILAHADGVFIAGGDQANYIRYWKGTPLESALDRHVRAGKPLGGSSAGLAILGRYSYGALDGGSIESATALHDPLGPAVTLESNFLHLPYLEEIITDSHFSTRKRLGRLIAFVARLNAEEKKSRIYGIGVDENTALCIEANGSGRVFSGSHGRAWLVMPQRAASTLRPGKPLGIEDVRVVGLDSQSRVGLRTFVVEQPASSRLASVVNGELSLR